MSYLFLDFSRHLEKGGTRQDFYNLSLNAQFKNFQERYPILKSFTLNSFIQKFFPSGMAAKYTFSCPNFIRDKSENDDRHISYLNNVVIKPTWDWTYDSFLPKNQNIILIGDIKETTNLASIEIKGMQLIDKNMKANKDISIVTSVVYCFEQRAWSIDSVHYSESVLSADFIADLMKNCYTVDDENMVHAYYKKWKKYIDFRNYYIKEQEKRHFEINNAVYCDSYAVNKKEYRRNSNIYDDYILDGNDDMKKGDMVVLNAPVEDADEFPLIRLDIDRNKHNFLQTSETRGSKIINKEEIALRSLARENVFITEDKPVANERGFFEIGSLMNKGFILGDRFKISKYEVLPEEHINDLRIEEKEKISNTNHDIELKYKKIIEDELSDKIKKYEDEENEKNNELIREKIESLNSQLDIDVLENNDPTINKEIKSIYSKIRSELTSNLTKDKKVTKKEFQSRLENEYENRISNIDIKEFYVKRNNEIINEYKSKLEKSLVKNKIRFTEYTKNELNQLYSNDLRKEQILKENEIHSEYGEYVNRIIESETIIRFSLYFRLPESKISIESKEKNIIKNCKYICYDSRAESAKIKRQEKALDNFFSGYVKNPYLSTYLFDPDKISENYIEENEIKYNLPNLNDAQKKAVNSALSSNGLFLLQGPPGTGKTHVIAELVSQYVMRGKKVLISSETHKAIDNVFERLPKIADIVPIRLIPSKGEKKRDNDYDPTHLMDNFYNNISHNMVESIKIYENFNAYKDEFNEKFNNLKLEKQKLDNSQLIIDKYDGLIKEKESKVNVYREKIKKLSDQFDKLGYELNDYRRTKKHIINDDLRLTDDIDKTYILNYRNYLFEQFDKTVFNVADFDEFVNNFKNIDIKKIEDELLLMQGNNEQIELEIKRDSVKAKMKLCRDEYDDVLPEKKSEYDELKSELKDIINKINNINNGSNNSLEINKIFSPDYINNHSNKIVPKIKDCQKLIEYKKNEISLDIDSNIEKIEDELTVLKTGIRENNELIKQIHNEIQDIKNEDEYKDVEKIKSDLDKSINDFIKNLHLNISYFGIDDALIKINLEWENLSENFETNEIKNKQMIPMYRKISNYITQEDVIDGDKPIYTKELFKSANVFGITCTASDKFSRNNLNSLSEFNIEDFNIKDVGIDVVIIDEVSKSSFVDLLIPILYGKTVILVGDHRQLPPMYEFAKMRQQDFEGLDPNIIDKDINKEFTDLYEECFFKRLFEDIHPNFKVMLNKQYRCHGDIMDVFNHFYNNQLMIGELGQNNKKKHNIDLMINGRTIISPDKHIYFINCNGKELQEVDSTSKSNKSEAKVVVELLSNLITYFKTHKDKEKLSLGVICTYGDQARKIKEMMKQQKVSRDYFSVGQEKQIISTVDDFQGDERDIIILSTVRNPIDPNKSNPEFILAYQRINVALSRARKLLIIVGNKNYLETRGVIDLPAIDGNSLHDIKGFRLYENIINTIQNKGKLLEETDIVVKEEGDVINA